MAEGKKFGIPDYVIFVLTLVISAAIGLFYAWRDKRQHSTENFLLGGRQMSIFPVTLSLMASFLSAVLVLGVPTEIYYHGTMYWVIAFSNILTFPVAVHAFLPVFHRLEISSAYEVNITINLISKCIAIKLIKKEQFFWIISQLACENLTYFLLFEDWLDLNNSITTFYVKQNK